MQQRILVLFFLLITLQTTILSQNKFSEINFQKVDDFARSVKYNDDLNDLIRKLTAPYSDSINKLRAIFIWITDNIEYDYKLFNSKDDKWRRFECTGTKAVCSSARIEWENEWMQHVLNKKKAVCSGYAMLFKKMCNAIGIENEMVAGYVKQNPFQIGLILNVSHDWNIVKLEGKTFVCDVTWAAGYCKADEESGKLLDFEKRFQNFYWLTPYHKFVRNHFPKDSKWITEANASKELFFNAPFFYPGSVTQNIESVSPDSGVITGKIGDTVHFTFSSKSQINKIQVNTNNYKNTDVLFKSKSAQPYFIYQFDYLVKENSLNYIELLFDGKKAIRYKVKY